MALAFGADDIDGTIGDTTKIYSMAGGIDRPTMSVEELEMMVNSVGYIPVERDSHYNRVERLPDTFTQEPTTTTEVKTPEATDMATKKENVQKKRATTATTKPKAQNSVKSKKSNTISFRKRRPLIANILYMGIVGIVLLVAVYVGLKVGTRHNRVIEIPNFMGMVIDDAYDVAESSDLKLIVRDSIFDVDLPGGTIVDQLPKISSIRDVTVKPGRKIYITVNAYTRRKVEIPYVAKQTLRQALNQIERSGLTVAKLVYEPDMTSTDYVIKQSVGNNEILPTSKRQAPVGSGITLHVSYQQKEENTQTPRLIGLNIQQAKSTLWDNGLNVANVVYDNSVEDIIAHRKARVYKQSSNIGASLRRGSEVTLYLTCDERLVDSMNIIATEELKALEKQRREALLERENGEEEVEE
jgi:beta-lactam-binding protein with PASTA domain